MLTTVCGWLGAAVGVVLGLITVMLTSTYHAYADGMRSGCVATGACATRDAEPLNAIIALTYFLGTFFGSVFLIITTVVAVCTRHTMETPAPAPPPPLQSSRRGRPE
jgi:hypothetical protein